ncbi:MAG: class I SAM-dependent methyltransferase [Nitrospirae bacterium]|nr:class I SAM-dependent methyltransferase [Nitrospirota bacterium]
MKNKEIRKYWENPSTESMYDKNLLEIEINSILELLNENDRVVDLGCGEGEGTVKYHEKVKRLIAVDFSISRLEKLRQKNSNIKSFQMDIRDISCERFHERFTKVITQRSLINLESFEEQKEVIKRIHSLLEDEGKYIMLEGFVGGTGKTNEIRKDFNLSSIEIKWHNLFFEKDELLEYTSKYFDLELSRDFSLYFFITRVFNAIINYPEIPKWDNAVNVLAKEMENKYKNSFIKGVSRLELLVFRKK